MTLNTTQNDTQTRRRRRRRRDGKGAEGDNGYLLVLVERNNNVPLAPPHLAEMVCISDWVSSKLVVKS